MGKIIYLNSQDEYSNSRDKSLQFNKTPYKEKTWKIVNKKRFTAFILTVAISSSALGATIANFLNDEDVKYVFNEYKAPKISSEIYPELRYDAEDSVKQITYVQEEGTTVTDYNNKAIAQLLIEKTEEIGLDLALFALYKEFDFNVLKELDETIAYLKDYIDENSSLELQELCSYPDITSYIEAKYGSIEEYKMIMTEKLIEYDENKERTM